MKNKKEYTKGYVRGLQLVKKAGYWSELIGQATAPIGLGLGVGTLGALAGGALGGRRGAVMGAGIGGATGLYGGALANTGGALGAAATKTRPAEDQADEDTDKRSLLKNLLIPGRASYNKWKRVGTSIRSPELKALKRLLAKEKGSTDREADNAAEFEL